MHLGLIGFGTITRTLLDLLAEAPVDELTLLVRDGAVAATTEALRGTMAAPRASATSDLAAVLAARPDLVVECAGQSAVRGYVPSLLDAGLPVVIASIGALADDALHDRLASAARRGRTRLILPAGAIGGIDLLAALAPAGGLSVTYRGTKPPAAWKGTPAERILDLDRLAAPATFFTGTAREAALAYPRNANVAATLALAGAGFDATRVSLVADPAARANCHAFEAISPLGRFGVEIENAATGGNAKTSLATVFSIFREIERHRRPIII